MADKKISALTASTTPLAGTEVLPIVQGGSTVKVSVANLTAGRTTSMSLLDVENAAGGGVLGTFKSNWSNTKVAVEGDGATGAGVLNISNVAASAALPFKVKLNGTEVIDVDTSGNAKATIGNFVVGTAGKGIDFSANTHGAGMTSELLNDYEEGTWTPTIIGSATAGTGTYTTQVGRYTKIGRTVHFTAYLVWTAHTGTGNMSIAGLPFSSDATANVFFQFSPFSSNLAYTANSQLQLLLFNNSTSLAFYQVNGGAAAAQVAIDTSADVLVTGTYSV
jgi:hypothetical protein